MLLKPKVSGTASGTPKPLPILPENKSIGNGFWRADTFCFWLSKPFSKLKVSGAGDVDAVPETEGIGWSETDPETFRFGNSFCVPKTFCFGNSFGSTYPDTLGFGNVIKAPETADFPE
jgi:hypothetical protein